MPKTPDIVHEVDTVLIWIIGIDVALLAMITFLMIFFAIKYHKSRHTKSEEIKEHPLLEITWTVTPTILVLVMFYYGMIGYNNMRSVPRGALVVKVIGAQWQWKFQYQNGKTTEVLYVPAGKPVKTILVSNDVIHGFYIPAYRVKRDVVPGMENYLWFEAKKPESVDIFCTQYCGLYHAGMHTKVVAMNETDFNKWYQSKDTTEPVISTMTTGSQGLPNSKKETDSSDITGTKGLSGSSFTANSSGASVSTSTTDFISTSKKGGK